MSINSPKKGHYQTDNNKNLLTSSTRIQHSLSLNRLKIFSELHYFHPTGSYILIVSGVCSTLKEKQLPKHTDNEKEKKKDIEVRTW